MKDFVDDVEKAAAELDLVVGWDVQGHHDGAVTTAFLYNKESKVAYIGHISSDGQWFVKGINSTIMPMQGKPGLTEFKKSVEIWLAYNRSNSIVQQMEDSILEAIRKSEIQLGQEALIDMRFTFSISDAGKYKVTFEHIVVDDSVRRRHYATGDLPIDRLAGELNNLFPNRLFKQKSSK